MPVPSALESVHDQAQWRRQVVNEIGGDRVGQMPDQVACLGHSVVGQLPRSSLIAVVGVQWIEGCLDCRKIPATDAALVIVRKIINPKKCEAA